MERPWYYVMNHEELHDGALSHSDARKIARQGWFGNVLYATTLLVSWVSAPLTLAVFGALAVFWMLVYRPEARVAATESGGHVHHDPESHELVARE